MIALDPGKHIPCSLLSVLLGNEWMNNAVVEIFRRLYRCRTLRAAWTYGMGSVSGQPGVGYFTCSGTKGGDEPAFS